MLRIKSSGLRPAFVAAVLAAIAGGAEIRLTHAAIPAKSMALRGVMKSLGRDMQTMTDAISNEDWALVAKTAPKIAHHAEPPPSERKLISDWLGSNFETFEAFDEQTHEAAQAVREAADSGDGQRVIEAFAKLQNSCLACHQRFRKPFVRYFYTQN